MSPETNTPALPWWEYLEALRLRRGWTRSQLAQRAGVARTTVDAWKAAPRTPLNTTVTSVAKRLDIDPKEALRLAGIVQPQDHPGETDSPEDATETEDSLSLEERIRRARRLMAKGDELYAEARDLLGQMEARSAELRAENAELAAELGIPPAADTTETDGEADVS